MIPLKFDCHAETIVGPLNNERMRQMERNRTSDFPHMTYDPAYVSYIDKNHGGVPKIKWFRTKKGNALRIGRFLNFGGPFNEPFEDNNAFPGTDIRLNWGIGGLETIANIQDGCGAFLVPFGLLYAGDHRPEDMQIVHIDLVCFDYSDMFGSVPSVVAWNNDAACEEYYACGEEGRDSWTEMRHDRFTDHVASSFTDFMVALCENKSDLKEIR